MIKDKRASKHKGKFELMTKSELRKVLDGYYAAGDFGPEFRKACEVYNTKYRTEQKP